MAEEMSVEQRQALALAAARLRLQQQSAAPGSAPGAGVAATPAPTSAKAPEASQPLQRAGGSAPVMHPLLALTLQAVGMSPERLAAAHSGEKDAILKNAIGLAQTFGWNGGQDVLREIRKEAEADPYGGSRKGGEIGANVAMTLAPGAVLEKTLRGAGALSKMRQAGAAAGAAGATEFATKASEGETLADRAADKAKSAGVAAGIGGALSSALSAISKPFRSTPEADLLSAQGVQPTLQQGADSAVGRFVGGLAAGSQPVRRRQLREAEDAVVRHITQGKASIPEATGREIVDHLDGYVAEAYKKALGGKKFPLSSNMLAGARQTAQQLNRFGQGEQAAVQAGRVVSDVIGDASLQASNRNLSYSTVYKDYLDELVRRSKGESDEVVAKRIMEARDFLKKAVIDRRLNPQELADLTRAEIAQMETEAVRKSVTPDLAPKVGLDFKKLSAELNRAERPGSTLREDLVDPMTRVLGDTVSAAQPRGFLVSAARAAAPVGAAGSVAALSGIPGVAPLIGTMYGTSILGQTRKGAKALLGQTEAQQKLAEFLRQYPVAPVVPGVTDIGGQ